MKIDEEINRLFDMSIPISKTLDHRAYVREYRWEHYEATQAAHRKYRETHREVLRERAREYRRSKRQ